MGDIMQEYNELFNKFDKLGLDAKRNAYSEEILKLSFLLKTCLAKYNKDLIDIPYNYKIGEDKKLSESDLLNINFRDIYILKTELLLLCNEMNVHLDRVE